MKWQFYNPIQLIAMQHSKARKSFLKHAFECGPNAETFVCMRTVKQKEGMGMSFLLFWSGHPVLLHHRSNDEAFLPSQSTSLSTDISIQSAWAN